MTSLHGLDSTICQFGYEHRADRDPNGGFQAWMAPRARGPLRGSGARSNQDFKHNDSPGSQFQKCARTDLRSPSSTLNNSPRLTTRRRSNRDPARSAASAPGICSIVEIRACPTRLRNPHRFRSLGLYRDPIGRVCRKLGRPLFGIRSINTRTPDLTALRAVILSDLGSAACPL